MNPSRDTSGQIAKELAAIESDIAQLRQKLRVLEGKRARLRITQSVLLALEGKETRRSLEPISTKEETRNGGARFFHSEGQTVKLVRYLYGRSSGSAVVEAAHRTGVPTRRARVAFERLCKAGLMSRSGNEYVLTQKGMAMWQESPLYGWEPDDYAPI